MAVEYKEKLKKGSKFGEVRKILNTTAIDMVIKYHYAHRKPANTKISYGLFLEDCLIGCIIYGNPFAIKTRQSLFRDPNLFDILELNRLFVFDGTPKNTESYFIGRTFKLLPKPIALVSYADTGEGHNGSIYQATNWIYTGLTDKSGCFSKILIGGKERTSKSLYDELGTQSKNAILEKYPEAIFIPYSVKHRYVHFLGCNKDKKLFLENLKPNKMPYPKFEET